MVIAKVLRVQGESATQIEDTACLLQDFLDKTEYIDLRRLLIKVKAKPSILKTALKFV